MENQHPLLKKLAGGDRRSIGKSDEVVADVLAEPSLFGVLIAGMQNDDPLIRMRAADAAEKITVEHPEYLQPHKKTLIDKISVISQQEVRWHLVQMFPRLEVSAAERRQIFDILLSFLDDKSKIVQTFSLQAMTDLAMLDNTLRHRVIEILRIKINVGSPAVSGRAKKLLKQINLKPSP